MTRKCDDCGKESPQEIPGQYYSHYSDYKCRSCYRKSRGFGMLSAPKGSLSKCSECNREEAPSLLSKAILIPKRAGLSIKMRRVCNQCGELSNLCNEKAHLDEWDGWLTLQGNISKSERAKKLDCVHCKGRKKLFNSIRKDLRHTAGINAGLGTFKPRTKWTHRYWRGVEMFESKAFPGFVHCHYCSKTDLVVLKTRERDDARQRAKEERAAQEEEKRRAEEERAAKKRRARERAAALAVQEELEAEHRYFDARFGLKETSLMDWEKTYKNTNELGRQSTREGRAPRLKKSGVHPLLVEAYTDGMIDMAPLRKLRKITPPENDEQFGQILKMTFRYEHMRALGGLKKDFGISKKDWGKLNRKWSGGGDFFAPKCMELISPGVAEERVPAKRLARQIEGLIQMNKKVEGILNRAVLLPEHEFEIINTMLGKEMGDEEQRLLRKFVEGSYDGSDVYEYIEEYGLGDPDLVRFLGRILDGEDVELVLDDAGLLNT